MVNKANRALNIIVFSFFFALTAYYIILPFFDTPGIHLDIQLPLWVFYTIQTNIFVCIWYGFILYGLLMGKARKLNQILSLSITVYIIVTGLVYWAVLIPMLGAPEALFRFRNIWTHAITPLFTIYCFMHYSRPQRISASGIPLTFIYPLAYLAFSYLFVHAVFGRYPYPFLNPSIMGGPLGIVAACAGMLIIFIGTAFLLRYIHNRRLFE